MEEKKKKRPRKKQPLIEYISDYLRYIILVAIIVVAAVVVVLVVKAVKGSDKADSDAEKTVVAVEEKSDVKEVKADTGAVSPVPTKTVEVPAVEEKSEPVEENKTEEEKETPEVKQEEPEDPNRVDTYGQAYDKVYKTVAKFVNAAANKDSASAEPLFMNMSDRERSFIDNGNYHEAYADLKVHLYNGAKENEYVVVFNYIYRERGNGNVLPGHDVRYMVKDSDGNYKFASDEVTAENQDLIDSVVASEPVQNLLAGIYSEDTYKTDDQAENTTDESVETEDYDSDSYESDEDSAEED